MANQLVLLAIFSEALSAVQFLTFLEGATNKRAQVAQRLNFPQTGCHWPVPLG
jgi:hypothetical protein